MGMRFKIIFFVLTWPLTLAIAYGVLRARGWSPPDPCRDCRSAPRPALPPPETETGQERLGPPEPGEWRHSFHEASQSLEAYAASNVNRRCPHRTTIYIQPLASRPGRLPFSPKCEAEYARVVERMREYLEAFFGVPTKLLPPAPMIERAYVEKRDQYDANKVAQGLVRQLPTDAIVCLGLTKEDLYSPGLNYVFGVGSLAARTGAYSLRRLQSDDPVLFLNRALKLVVHETGHIFSIEHCTEWRCLMQGANSVAEQDGQPLRLCPVDLRKLEWNTGGDRRARYGRLLELNRRYGFRDEADWIEKRLKSD